MDINNVINDLLEIPQRFKGTNQSVYKLLEATGYFGVFDRINEKDILNSLMKKQHLVDEWLLWSENKRSVSGWYFKRESDNKYIIGYFSNQNINIPQIEYSDAKEACANFIKKEIEDIRIIS